MTLGDIIIFICPQVSHIMNCINCRFFNKYNIAHDGAKLGVESRQLNITNIRLFTHLTGETFCLQSDRKYHSIAIYCVHDYSFELCTLYTL